jgi:hypothetical protein
MDANNNLTCAKLCTSSNQCSAPNNCCTPLKTGSQSVCYAPGGKYCRCATGAECSSGCCAPATDATGNPVGPYVCKPNDGAAYNCCFGVGTPCSGSAYCCVADASGNQFCATQCVNSSMCGGARCLSYDFSHSSCGGPSACGP